MKKKLESRTIFLTVLHAHISQILSSCIQTAQIVTLTNSALLLELMRTTLRFSDKLAYNKKLLPLAFQFPHFLTLLLQY